jgi:hypothetical protein
VINAIAQPHEAHHSRIDGETPADLDFSTMFTRLATPGSGPIHRPVTCMPSPGLEGYRDGVKLAINAFLFTRGRKQGWPKEMSIGVGELVASLLTVLPWLLLAADCSGLC